jgi:hypothetical protein
MNCYYSILKFVNNELSNESISLGLLMLYNDKVTFRVSERKMNIVKKLNAQSIKTTEFTIKQISDYFNSFNLNNSGVLFRRESLDVEYINRLSVYNNGIIQFSKIATINTTTESDKIFDRYFCKLIDSIAEEDEKSMLNKSIFQLKIEEKLYEPLKDKIDVDFTIKADQIPSLFFDYHLDGIGVNGAMFAAKAIDFKKNESNPRDAKAQIAEFETLIDRLDNLSRSKGIDEAGNYYLIVDTYDGSSRSLAELYSLLKKDQMPHFNFISPDKIDDLVELIINKSARKFSTEILNTN